MYKYFIYYSFITKDGREGCGNMVSSLVKPIRNMSNIEEIQDSIKMEYSYIDNVVISNFISL